jgi:hypothetical protein
MLSLVVGLTFVFIGVCFVVFNGAIAAKQVRFQRLVGSIWTGPKSFTFAKVINVIGGIWINSIAFRDMLDLTLKGPCALTNED